MEVPATFAVMSYHWLALTVPTAASAMVEVVPPFFHLYM